MSTPADRRDGAVALAEMKREKVEKRGSAEHEARRRGRPMGKLATAEGAQGAQGSYGQGHERLFGENVDLPIIGDGACALEPCEHDKGDGPEKAEAEVVYSQTFQKPFGALHVASFLPGAF